MANYAVTSFDPAAPRSELHEALKLTSCEISFNQLPAGAAIPFIHFHKENEEIYLITKGAGTFYMDGDLVEVKEGDSVRIDPPCERCIKAGPEGISYYCIQAKRGSLGGFTMTDAGIVEGKTAF